MESRKTNTRNRPESLASGKVHVRFSFEKYNTFFLILQSKGLAQAGAWLARKFVGIFNLCARANGSEPPAFAKPPPRWLQSALLQKQITSNANV
jgi:hypothetical protein